MDNLIFLYKYNGKVRKKHEWKCVIESTCLEPSLHLVQDRMVKTCTKRSTRKDVLVADIHKSELYCKVGTTFQYLRYLSQLYCTVGTTFQYLRYISQLYCTVGTTFQYLRYISQLYCTVGTTFQYLRYILVSQLYCTVGTTFQYLRYISQLYSAVRADIWGQ